MSKIFFIGFNKTGTSSIAKSLELVGYKNVIHKGIWADWALTKNKKELDKYDVFTDSECPHLAHLDELYPDAKFILNSRTLEGWVGSRYKLIESTKLLVTHFLTTYVRLTFIVRLLERFILNNSEKAILRWVEIRENYHAYAKEYFKDRPSDFLEIDIEDESTTQKLIDFLNLDQSFKLVHINTNSSHTSTGKLLRALDLEVLTNPPKEKISTIIEQRNQQTNETLTAAQQIDNFNDRSIRYRMLSFWVGLRAKSRSYLSRYIIDLFISLCRDKQNMNYYTSVRRMGGGSF